MKYSHIFWDWNGTLIDDMDACIEGINLSLSKRDLPLVTETRYKDIFEFPVINYYKRLGFNFETDPYDILAHEFIDNYNRLALSAKLTAGTKDVLSRLARAGAQQYILSASEYSMLKCGLSRLDVPDVFSDIIACTDIYAGGKAGLAKVWLSKNPHIKKAVLIGDTTHDFEVASALGFDCVLFLEGHGKEEHLRETGAPVFSSLSQILDYLLTKQ